MYPNADGARSARRLLTGTGKLDAVVETARPGLNATARQGVLMAKATRTKPTQAKTGMTGDAVEERLLAFADQMGTMVGTVQRRAEGWLESEAVRAEVARIKDSASDLLEYMNSLAPSLRGREKGTPRRPPKSVATPAKGSKRGPVDAPGKRHRKPPPQELGSRRMTDPKGSQTGPQKVKAARRRGRG